LDTGSHHTKLEANSFGSGRSIGDPEAVGGACVIDLLRKWAELEPDRCKIVRSREALTVFELEITDIQVDHDFAPSETPKIAAISSRYPQGVVLGAVISAIDDHPTLRFSLANASDGFHASIRSAEENVPLAIDYRDDNAAIALLTAYLQWLEQSKEAQNVA
jgi:hypothetical protein